MERTRIVDVQKSWEEVDVIWNDPYWCMKSL